MLLVCVLRLTYYYQGTLLTYYLMIQLQLWTVA